MKKRPSNDIEVITNEPTDCCNWAMDTTLSTGIGNRHKAGEIPRLEIGCVIGSFLNPR